MIKFIINKINTEKNAHKLVDYLLSEKSKENATKVVGFLLRHGVSNKVLRYVAIKLSSNLFKAPTPQVARALLHKIVTLAYTPMGKRVIAWVARKIVSAIKNSKTNVFSNPFIKSFVASALDEVVNNKLLRNLLRRVYA